MRLAVSLILKNEIGNHLMVRCFCKGLVVLKPLRPRYDYVWDPALVIKTGLYLSIRFMQLITKKLVLLFVLGMGQQILTLLKVSHISIGKSDNSYSRSNKNLE